MPRAQKQSLPLDRVIDGRGKRFTMPGAEKQRFQRMKMVRAFRKTLQRDETTGVVPERTLALLRSRSDVHDADGDDDERVGAGSGLEGDEFAEHRSAGGDESEGADRNDGDGDEGAAGDRRNSSDGDETPRSPVHRGRGRGRGSKGPASRNVVLLERKRYLARQKEVQKQREEAMLAARQRQRQLKQNQRQRIATHKQLSQRTRRGQPVMKHMLKHMLSKLEKE